MAERRVILLGKTGNGKSSTGNSILEDEIFKSESSLDSVTSTCDVQKRTRRDNRDFKVCDTPGLFCSGEDPIEIALKIQKSVELCPNPHAFLLVFSSVARMTADEKYTINLLRVIFGDKMFDHCIVVFTRGDEIKTDFDAFWKKSNELKTIVGKCGDRVVKIENAKNCTSNTGLESLLNMIEQMANNGTYEYRYLKDHSEVLQEYKLKYGVSKSEDMDKHLNEILDTLRKRLEEKERLADKQQEDLNRQVLTLTNCLEENEKKIKNLKRENENSYCKSLNAFADGVTRVVQVGAELSKFYTQSSASSGLARPDSSSLGGGLPGSSSFGGNLPGSSSFGGSLPGSSSLSSVLPGSSSFGGGLPGSSSFGGGLPGSSSFGGGLPGSSSFGGGGLPGSSSLGGGMPDSSSIGGRLSGSSSFGGGLPGSSSFGGGSPGSSPFGGGLPGSSSFGGGLPGSSSFDHDELMISSTEFSRKKWGEQVKKKK